MSGSIGVKACGLLAVVAALECELAGLPEWVLDASAGDDAVEVVEYVAPTPHADGIAPGGDAASRAG